jgi:hypothetical protein
MGDSGWPNGKNAVPDRPDLYLRGIGNVEALTHQSLALPALLLHADQREGIED